MCGRYALFDTSKSKLKFTKQIKINYNISPNSKVHIINNKNEIVSVNWALKAFWSDKINIINARSETLEDKQTFKNTDRCIFIANGYFEWMKSGSIKKPFYHTFNDRMMYFGGVMNKFGACIVTRNSYSNISYVHNRQPIILRYDDFSKWFLRQHDYECIHSNEIEIYRVTNRVNNPRNNNYENIKRY